MTTLAYSNVVITIPEDLTWQDEYSWREVEQKKTYSITGSLLIESAQRLAGRTIVLGGDAESGWVTRVVVETLRIAASLAGQQFTLTLRGAAHTVLFDHEGGAFEASPIVDYADPIAADAYAVTLRFLKIAQL